MKLISACLVGINCKYDGNTNLPNLDSKILEEYKQGKLIPVCPEQLGGLKTPRVPAQIQNASGEDVIDGKAKILTEKGTDLTEQFVKGAEEVLKIAKALNIKEAILKQRSPSCGCGQINDGSFTKTVKSGDGITTALLKRNGINVTTEED